MTIQAYQTLYESSVAFGMRKALQAEQKKAEMVMQIHSLENTCEELEREVDRLKGEIHEMLDKEKEDKERDEEEHQQYMQRSTELNLSEFQKLEKILSDLSGGASK